jgi:DNA repair protein RecO (recombination protein O)
MTLVATPAIVLHAFDYLETSRVLRLLTREAAVVSVIAKGARRTRARVGSGVDLFAEGEAQIYLKPSRDLHTLGTFDVTRVRAGIALDIGRFMASSAIAELVLRISGDEPNPSLFDTVSTTLDDLASAPRDEVTAHALAGAWRIVASAGFTPSLDECASCHAAIAPDEAVAFSHVAGGALCSRCARLTAATRQIPAAARDALRGWLDGAVPIALGAPDARAHQRLLREFLREHVSADRPLRAFMAWEADVGAAHAGSGP